MAHASLALQKAIYAALIADADVGALIGDRIYDATPRDALFPYVGLGQATFADWSSSTEHGTEHRIILNAWSRQRGKSECDGIVAAVTAALDDATLTLAGHALVNLRFEFGSVDRDPDGITWHAVMRFRAVTEAA